MRPQFSSVPREIGRSLGTIKREGPNLPKDCLWRDEEMRGLILPWMDVLRKAVHFEMPSPDPDAERANGWRDLLIQQKIKGVKPPFPALTVHCHTDNFELFTIWSQTIVNPMEVAIFLPDLDEEFDCDTAVWGRTFILPHGVYEWDALPYDLATNHAMMNKEEGTKGYAIRHPLGVYERTREIIKHAGGNPDTYDSEFALFDTLALRTFWSLCTAFDLGRVASTEKKIILPHQQSKKGATKNKKTKSFYEIHRIVYDPSKLPVPPAPPKGGTHASPRWHKRRGYWRTLRKSGKVVWVQACEVGNKSNGMVYKDYEVTGIIKQEDR